MSQLQSSLLTLSSPGTAVGAVVAGIDASRPVAAADILALKQGLRDHGILIYRRQDLSEEQFKAFATYFGSVFLPPSDVPVLASGPDGVTPEIVRISNVDGYTGTGELSLTRTTTGRRSPRLPPCCMRLKSRRPAATPSSTI